MLVCPNKNSKQYKELINTFGVSITEYLFEENNYELPNMTKAVMLLNNLDNEDAGSVISFDIKETNPIMSNQAFATIKSLIPDIKPEEVIFVANLINGKKGAEFRKGIISFYTNDNRVDLQIIKHEIFHKLWNQYIPVNERENIYNVLDTFPAYQEYIKNKTNDRLTKEEFLAEQFQSYVNNKPTLKTLKGFFKHIKNIIYRIVGINRQLTPNKVELLFNNIYKGKYNTRLITNESLNNIPHFIKQLQIHFKESSKAESIIAYHTAKLYVKKLLAQEMKNGANVQNAARIVQAHIIREAIRNNVHESFKKLDLKGTELEYIKSLDIPAELSKTYTKLDDKGNPIHDGTTKKTLHYLAKNGANATGLIIEDMFVTFNRNAKTYEELMEEYKGDITSENQDALYSEMIDTIMTNYYDKLSQVVKRELSFIEVDDKILDPAYAYVLAMQLYNTIDFNQDSVKVKKELDKIITNTKKKYNKAQIAVATHIRNILRNTKTPSVVLPIVKEIESNLSFTFPSDNMFVTLKIEDKVEELFIRKSDGTPVTKYSTIDDIVTTIVAKYFKNKDEATIKYVKENLKRIKTHIKYVLEAKKNQNTARQFYSEIGSLIENNPIHFDKHTKEKYGEKAITYKTTPISPSSMVTSYEENLTTYFALNTHYTVQGILDATGSESTLSPAELSSIEKNFAIIKKNKVIKDDEVDLSSATTYIREIAKFLGRHSNEVQAQNYFDARGNRRYIWGMGSWLFNSYKLIKEGIYKAKFSAIENGLIGVGKLVTLDSFRNRNNYDVTNQNQYKNFKLADYINAHFFGGFISNITQKHQTPVYLQSLYTQSNRPTDDFIEVTYSDQANLEKIAEVNRKWQTTTNENIKKVKLLVEKKNTTGWDSLTKEEKDFYKSYAKANYNSIDNLFFNNNEELFAELDKLAKEAFDVLMQYSPNHKADALQINQAVARLGKIPDTLKEDALKIGEAYKVNPNLYIAFNMFFKNNYIVGHQVNAHIFGDVAATKNTTDLIKRMQGVKSPGKTQLTNSDGTRNKVRVITAKDSVVTKQAIDNIKKIWSKILGMDVEQTDAVTFGTPNTLKLLQEGTGDYSLSAIIKTVMFQIDENGLPHYNKTALFIITDDLAEQFPELKAIRDFMEKEYVNEDGETVPTADYYTFKSAYKLGRPLDEDLFEGTEGNLEANVTEWNNTYVRIQSNPRHDEGEVSNPLQNNYFLNQSVNNEGETINEIETHNAYNIDAELMHNTLEQLKLSTDIVDSNGNIDVEKVRQVLTDMVQDREGDLLEDGMSMNYPYLVKTLIIQLSNLVSKNSVKIKHSGNKLINQSDFGISLFNGQTYDTLSDSDKILADKFFALDGETKKILINYKTVLDQFNDEVSIDEFNSMFKTKWNLNDEQFALLMNTYNQVLVPRALLMKNKDNFTEVIAPAWWKDYGIKLGDNAIYNDLLKQGFAIRIPTTGIHSGLAIKIVGFNDDINGIIVPSEVVAIHGSDFDVDALYFMHREVADKEYNLNIVVDEDLNELAQSHLNEVIEILDDRKEDHKQVIEKLIELKEEINKEKELLKSNVKSSEEINKEFNTFVSNPNYSPSKKTNIIRKELENYNEKRAKTEYAAFNNYSYDENADVFKSNFKSKKLASLYKELSKTYNLITQSSSIIQNAKDNVKIVNANLIQSKTISEGTIIGYTEDGEWNNELEQELKDSIQELSEARKLSQSFKEKYKDSPTHLKIAAKLDSNVKKLLINTLTIQNKLLKNKKFDIYLRILTKPETQEDTTTPIEFDSVKTDITSIKKDNLPHHIKNSLINDKYTFKEIQDAIVVSGDVVTVTNPEIKQLLLDSKLGVKGKLQIVKGTTLEEKRNPNNFLHQMMLHKDNFEGVSGTGIQANLMKVVSYLMQGSVIKVNGKEIAIEDIADIREEEINVDNIPAEERVKLYAENGITKEDGTAITINDIQNEPLKYQLIDNIVNTSNLEEGLNWIKQVMPDANIELVNELIDGIGKGAYNSVEDLIILSTKYANKATAKHEIGHRALAILKKNNPQKYEDIMNEGAKLFGIERGDNKTAVKYSQEQQNQINYTLKAVDLLQSDKAIQLFKTLEKNKVTGDTFWKKVQELGIPKEQIQLLKQYNTTNREELITNMLADYSFVVEKSMSVVKRKEDNESYIIDKNEVFNLFKVDDIEYFQELNGMYKKYEDGVITPILKSEYLIAQEEYKNVPTNIFGYLNIIGGKNYREFKIRIPGVINKISSEGNYHDEDFNNSRGDMIGWIRDDEKENDNFTRRILEFQSGFQKVRDEQSLFPLLNHKEWAFTTNYDISTKYDFIEYFGKVDENIEAYTKDFESHGNRGNIVANLEKYTKLKNTLKDITDAYNKYVSDTRKNQLKNNAFLQLLNKNNNWVTFFIKSIIQDSVKEGYEKVLFPTGNTSVKIESPGTGINTIEDAKNQNRANLANTGLFYENTVQNILKKQFGQVNRITDEYGNEWFEVDLSNPKVKEQTENIKFQAPSLQYEGDLAIEEKIMEMMETSFDEKLPKTLLGKWIQSVKNFFNDLFTASNAIQQFIRNVNQGKIQGNAEGTNTMYQEQTAKEKLQEILNNKQKSQYIATLIDGTEGILERSKVELKDLDFVIDGKNYNTLERLNEQGNRTTEISDTILNGYIDNVKEQITWILNANGDTINKIGLMVYMGIPLDKITYIMNQPAIKELSEVSSYGKDAVVNKYKTELENYELTTQDLIDNLTEPTNKVQYKVIKLIQSLEKYTDELQELSNQLQILKGLPIKEDVIKHLKTKNKVNNFTSPNFYDIQHIKEAFDSLEFLDIVISNSFVLSSTENTKFINNIKSSIDFQKEFSKESRYDEIKQDLEKFILASWIEELKKTKEIKQTEYVGLDATGNKVKTNPVTALSTEEMWVQDFIEELENYRKESPSTFLNFFAVKLKNNVKYLMFNGGTSLKDDKLIEAMQGFLDLPPDLKRKFVIYSVLKDGSRFGFRGFTNIISYENSSKEVKDGLEDVVNHYNEALLTFDANKENLKNLFITQFLKNNADLLIQRDSTVFLTEQEAQPYQHVLDMYEEEVKIGKDLKDFILVNGVIYYKIAKEDEAGVYIKVGYPNNKVQPYKYHASFESVPYEISSEITAQISEQINLNGGEFIHTFAKNKKYKYKESITTKSMIYKERQVSVKVTRNITENEVTDTYKVIDEINEQQIKCNL